MVSITLSKVCLPFTADGFIKTMDFLRPQFAIDSIAITLLSQGIELNAWESTLNKCNGS